MHPDFNKMTVKELRRYAVEKGFGVTYLSERKKDELVRILEELTKTK